MGAVLGVRLRNYGFTDLPPSLPLPRSDPVTRIYESSYRRLTSKMDRASNVTVFVIFDGKGRLKNSVKRSLRNFDKVNVDKVQVDDPDAKWWENSLTLLKAVPIRDVLRADTGYRERSERCGDAGGGRGNGERAYVTVCTPAPGACARHRQRCSYSRPCMGSVCGNRH